MNATGMLYLYPGVCSEDSSCSRAHCYGVHIIHWRRQTFFLSFSWAFSGPQLVDEQTWKPTLFIFVMRIIMIMPLPGFKGKN